MGYEYTYGRGFFDFVTASSAKSARLFLDHFVPVAFGAKPPESILDIGCGRGVWPADWLRRGASTVIGVDGAYVGTDSLLIPVHCFTSANLAEPLELGHKFDLVECLEVAEHVPEAHAETLIDTLVRHSDIVLFSSAVPGQGGEFHVNEQPYEYWRAKFASRGYKPYDTIRRAVYHLKDVEPWYRYNAFLYANESGACRLTEAARSGFVPDATKLANLAPLWWRTRCMVLSTIPGSVTNQLARLKHLIANRAL